ncbi:MAG TPA: hypothetical protein VF060_05600 [Trebonia sp.]
MGVISHYLLVSSARDADPAFRPARLHGVAKFEYGGLPGQWPQSGVLHLFGGR